VRGVFAGNSQCLLSVVDLEIHLYGELWLAGTDVGSFSLAVFSFVALDEALGLVDEDTVSG
jgi:hypothetical protein